MNIRRAALGDLEAIASLERQAGAAAHWSEAHYTKALTQPDRLALAAEEDGRLAGFLVASAAGPEWELENVVVAPDAQRRGTGSRLVRELLRTARAGGATAIFLEVRESNMAARRLYESTGFVAAGRRPAYYQGPEEDALVYCLFLAEIPAKTVEGAHPV